MSADTAPSERFPRVSVIIPCRNERNYIARCLDSLLASDYPRDRLEILVVDGRSEDGTRGIVEAYAQRYACIRLLDNPRKITPVAFNTGIAHSGGEFLMITSAHGEIDSEHIPACVRASLEFNADNVGGILRTLPRSNTLMGRSIALALAHPFGVGNSHFRTNPGQAREVDTVFGGFYRRTVFDRIGLFNERLVRSQDMEFNRRLHRSGGRIVLVPSIVQSYFAISDYIGFCRHNLKNGLWSILPLIYSQGPSVSARHLVPLVFVLSLVTCGVFSFFSDTARVAFVALVGLYATACLGVSVAVARAQKDIRYVPSMVAAFAGLHVLYGLGSLWGCVRLIGEKLWELASTGIVALHTGSYRPTARPSLDYSTVSEVPGDRITHEAMAMLLARYAFAAGLAERKDVLEVACGAGYGLGLLAARARRLVAGDYSQTLLNSARAHYSERVPLLRFSAECMPFPTASFDVVVCLEAMYYFPNAERFVEECRRVLRPGGLVFLCTASKEWRGFAPGALTTRYFSARELSALLEDNGFQTKLLGAFPGAPETLFSRVVLLIRAAAVSLHLVPPTMHAKEPLKRLFYGPLVSVPAEISSEPYNPAALTPIPPDAAAGRFKVIYAIGRR